MWFGGSDLDHSVIFGLFFSSSLNLHSHTLGKPEAGLNRTAQQVLVSALSCLSCFSLVWGKIWSRLALSACAREEIENTEIRSNLGEDGGAITGTKLPHHDEKERRMLGHGGVPRLANHRGMLPSFILHFNLGLVSTAALWIPPLFFSSSLPVVSASPPKLHWRTGIHWFVSVGI